MKHTVKKLSSLFLALSLMAGLCLTPALAAETDYADADGSWAKSSIQRWSDYGVVEGDGSGFNPDADLTRGELAAIMVRLLGLTEKPTVNPYADLTGAEWYADAILKCTTAGIIKGDGTNCGAENTISRQETAVMTARALGVAPDPNADLGSFSDSAQVADWAAGYVSAMASAGILSGTDTGDMAPGGNIDRASTVALLDKAVSDYITEPGSYEVKGTGITLVNSKGAVTLTGAAQDILIAPGASTGSVTLDKATVSGTVTVNAPDVQLAAKSSKIAEVVVTGSADDTKISVDAGSKVEAVANEAPGLKVDGKGTVGKVDTKTDAAVTTPNTVTTMVETKVDDKGNTVTTKVETTNNSSGKPGTIKTETTTTSPNGDTTTEEKTEKPNPPSGGGNSTTYYSVTFDTNGGSAIASASVASGEKAAKPADPTKDSYAFYGWFLNGAPYDFSLAVTGSITLTAQWGRQAAMDTWTSDRTEPGEWNISPDGWTTLVTTARDAATPENWYDWQGRGAVTDADYTSDWSIDTQIELTEAMMNGTGIRASVWVQVDAAGGTLAQNDLLSWAILQYKHDPNTNASVWQWYGNEHGADWRDIDSITPTVGIHAIRIQYRGGTIYQYIDGVLVNSYEVNVGDDRGFGDVSAPSYVILQSRTLGDSYTVKWKLPEVKYLEQHAYNIRALEIPVGGTLQAAMTTALKDTAKNIFILPEGSYAEQIILDGTGVDREVAFLGFDKVDITGPSDYSALAAEAVIAGETSTYSGLVVLKNFEKTVTLDGLTIHGDAAKASAADNIVHGSRYLLLALLDSSATLRSVTLTDVAYSDDLKGMQNGIALYAVSAAASTLTVTDSIITNFNKCGILTRDKVELLVTDTTITGYGTQAWIAQNGIQCAGMSEIAGSTISGLNYIAENEWKYGSCGVLDMTQSPNFLHADGNTYSNVDTPASSYHENELSHGSDFDLPSMGAE